MNAQAANTVVHSPSLLPMADWVMFEVRTILLGHFEKLFALVPGGVRIELDAQGGRQHAGGQIFGIVAGFFFGLAERMMLGQIAVLFLIGRDGHADRGRH